MGLHRLCQHCRMVEAAYLAPPTLCCHVCAHLVKDKANLIPLQELDWDPQTVRLALNGNIKIASKIAVKFSKCQNQLKQTARSILQKLAVLSPNSENLYEQANRLRLRLMDCQGEQFVEIALKLYQLNGELFRKIHEIEPASELIDPIDAGLLKIRDTIAYLQKCIQPPPPQHPVPGRTGLRLEQLSVIEVGVNPVSVVLDSNGRVLFGSALGLHCIEEGNSKMVRQEGKVDALCLSAHGTVLGVGNCSGLEIFQVYPDLTTRTVSQQKLMYGGDYFGIATCWNQIFVSATNLKKVLLFEHGRLQRIIPLEHYVYGLQSYFDGIAVSLSKGEVLTISKELQLSSLFGGQQQAMVLASLGLDLLVLQGTSGKLMRLTRAEGQIRKEELNFKAPVGQLVSLSVSGHNLAVLSDYERKRLHIYRLEL